jgi:hypothetical protein
MVKKLLMEEDAGTESGRCGIQVKNSKAAVCGV